MKLNGETIENRGNRYKTPTLLDVDGNPLVVDKMLWINLRKLRRNRKHYNGDGLIVIDGPEGAGKSTFARQIAKILDPQFTEKQICFSTKDYRKKSFDYGDWRALVLDESKQDLDRKNTMSRKNKMFTSFLSESRQLHKWGIIVLPSIFDLDSYVAEHRATMLVHVYKHKGKNLGFFTCYGMAGIKKLFLFGKKYRSYNQKPSFTGRFSKQEVVSLDRYNEMKRKAIEKYNPSDDEELRTPEEVIKDFIYERIRDFEDKRSRAEVSATIEAFCDSIGIGTTTYYRYKKEALPELKGGLKV